MTGICIDGPLLGEMIQFDGCEWVVQLPLRETWCDCNPEADYSSVIETQRVVYRPILRGIRGKVALLSIEDDEEKILADLTEWVMTDLGARTKKLLHHCRDRRAWR